MASIALHWFLVPRILAALVFPGKFKRFSIRAKQVKVVKKMATSSLTKTMNRRSKMAVCLFLYKEDQSGFFFPEINILIILQFFCSSNYRSMTRKVALLYIKFARVNENTWEVFPFPSGVLSCVNTVKCGDFHALYKTVLGVSNSFIYYKGLKGKCVDKKKEQHWLQDD